MVDTRLESDISLNSNIEELNSAITRSIITAAENTISRTKNVGKRPIPWWNSDCQRAVRRKKAAFLKMKRTFKIDDVLAFKKSRSECRRTILNAKRRCWEAYCSTMDIKTNVKTVWRTVRALSGIYCGKTFPDLKTDDGGTISDDRSKANAIANVLAEVSSTNNYPPGFPTDEVMLDITDPEISAIYQEANDPLNRMFTLAELQCAISSRKNASPGRDSVCYPMLKKLPVNSLKYLLRLVNSSWSTGTVPAAWKHSIIVPIPKNGKDPTSAKSYRPISLTSHIGKVMEVMVVNRLRWFLETHGLLHISLSAFRRERSTVDHILRLHDAIYKSLINQRSVMAVFLDIERAYDMVWRDGLITKLFKMGIRGQMLRWIRALIYDRSFQVKLE